VAFVAAASAVGVSSFVAAAVVARAALAIARLVLSGRRGGVRDEASFVMYM
jgi:hypothetical protein